MSRNGTGGMLRFNPDALGSDPIPCQMGIRLFFNSLGPGFNRWGKISSPGSEPTHSHPWMVVHKGTWSCWFVGYEILEQKLSATYTHCYGGVKGFLLEFIHLQTTLLVLRWEKMPKVTVITNGLIKNWVTMYHLNRVQSFILKFKIALGQKSYSDVSFIQTKSLNCGTSGATSAPLTHTPAQYFPQLNTLHTSTIPQPQLKHDLKVFSWICFLFAWWDPPKSFASLRSGVLNLLQWLAQGNVLILFLHFCSNFHTMLTRQIVTP